MTSQRLLVAGAIALGLSVAPLSLAAAAPLQNGDFEAGNVGWTPSAPAGWTISFLAAGGNPNGYASIMSPFGNSGGIACIGQEFDCGTPGGGSYCHILLDYRLTQVDAAGGTGRIVVQVDGLVDHVSPDGVPAAWQTIDFAVPCGAHRIDLCLQVDDGNNGWRADFDNVRAECMSPTPALPRSWGAVKVIYR